MIQLKLTTAGATALANTLNTPLTITHFLCGSSYDEDEQAIQTATPFQFDIVYQQTYVKGQQYEKDGVTVTETNNHIKIIGFLSSDDITFEDDEYTVKEIALIGSVSGNNICLAYGYDIDGIKLQQGSEIRYTVKLDLVFDRTPNITVNSSINNGVSYSDFQDHVDNVLNSSNPVHGLTYVNQRLYINGSPLVIDVSGVKNTSFNGAIGISEEVEVLPSASTEVTGKVVIDKETGTMSQVVETGGVKSWQTLYPLLTQINAMGFLPLRQDSTPYTVGDVVKIAGLSPFQYLECIATGTSASSLPSFNRTTGHATQDGTAIWLVCDMRDGLQPGDFKLHIANTDLAGYIKDNQTILHFDQQTPIENATNWRLLRLFRLILNQALYTYSKTALFGLTVTASINTASTNPVLLHGAGVVIMNEWCNFCPTTLTTIEDITLQDYIDISAYNSANSVSYTEAQYKQTAQTLLTDILAGSGAIDITVSSLDDRFIRFETNNGGITILVEDALPDFVGGANFDIPNSTSIDITNTSGALFTDSDYNTTTKKLTQTSNTFTAKRRLVVRPSRANAIYGGSNNVIPKGVQLRPFIKY